MFSRTAWIWMNSLNPHHCGFVLLQLADLMEEIFIFLFKLVHFVISLTLHWQQNAYRKEDAENIRSDSILGVKNEHDCCWSLPNTEMCIIFLFWDLRFRPGIFLAVFLHSSSMSPATVWPFVVLVLWLGVHKPLVWKYEYMHISVIPLL